MNQQTVKNRMAKHKQDTRQLFLKGKHSDSFAAHFDQLIPEGTESKEVKKPYQVQTRNSLARQPACYHQNLWNKRIQTLCKRTPGNLETHLSTPHLAINRCIKIYGACCHNPGFHRFNIKEENNVVSTDEQAINARRTPKKPDGHVLTMSIRGLGSLMINFYFNCRYLR
jgi:hypothetical protein